jgi:hypothetical protein
LLSVFLTFRGDNHAKKTGGIMRVTVATATTIKGLSRIITNSYKRGFEVAIMKDSEGLYLLGYAQMSFPSSNKDTCIVRLHDIDYQAIKGSLKWVIENDQVEEKSVLGKYRIF